VLWCTYLNTPVLKNKLKYSICHFLHIKKYIFIILTCVYSYLWQKCLDCLNSEL
jgi:hypothetical protein